MKGIKKLTDILRVVVVLVILVAVATSLYTWMNSEIAKKEDTIAYLEGSKLGILSSAIDTKYYAGDLSNKEYGDFLLAYEDLFYDFTESNLNRVVKYAVQCVPELSVEIDYVNPDYRDVFITGYCIEANKFFCDHYYNAGYISDEEYQSLVEEYLNISDGENFEEASEYLKHLISVLEEAEAKGAKVVKTGTPV